MEEKSTFQSRLSVRGRLVSRFWLMVCLFTSDTSEHARLDHPSDREAPPIPGDLCLTKCAHLDVPQMILVSH